jgi:hypothetical protein
MSAFERIQFELNPCLGIRILEEKHHLLVRGNAGGINQLKRKRLPGRIAQRPRAVAVFIPRLLQQVRGLLGIVGPRLEIGIGLRVLAEERAVDHGRQLVVQFVAHALAIGQQCHRQANAGIGKPRRLAIAPLVPGDIAISRRCRAEFEMLRVREQVGVL